MIGRQTVVWLGLSQLVCWGITYYLIGALGELIAADLGWSRSLVYGGFSMALLVMGVSSPLVGRLIDRYGGRLHPLTLNLLAALVLPVCFAAGLFSGQLIAAAIAFTLVYGAGNGILTITRGTLPLVLFDHRTYGALVGRLLVPSFLFSAVAPLGFALVIERLGEAGALVLSILIALTTLAAAIALRLRFGR